MARHGANMEDPGWGEGSRFAAHLDRGWFLLENGDLMAARTSAQEARQIRPDDPDAPLLLGAIALAQEKPTESVEWYERALELDPDYVEPYAAAASVCLAELGRPERALVLCDRAVQLDHLLPLERLDLQLLATEAELSMGQEAAARARLGGLGAAQVLVSALGVRAVSDDAAPPPIHPDASPAETAAVRYLYYDGEGEPLEPEERIQPLVRLLGQALRLSRLGLDLGQVDQPRELLRTIVDRFPQEADAWHLLSEAEYLAGDAAMATQGALRTLRLDAQGSLHPLVPSVALMHARVLELLRNAPADAIRALAKRPVAFSVLVHEVVPEELVLEGMDPRLAVVALSVRGGPAGAAAPPFLSGVAVYRRSLARLGLTQEEINDQLRSLLYEELAMALELPDEERTKLGLSALRDPSSDSDDAGR